VGISTGIAGLGAVFLSQIRPNTVDALDSSATGRTILAHDSTNLSSAFAGGDVRRAAASYPAGTVRNTLVEAYRIGFTTTFNHLMDIALVIALVGAVGSFFLVRQRDFVPSLGPGGAALIETEKKPPVVRPAGHSRRRRRKRPGPVPVRRPVSTVPAPPDLSAIPPLRSELHWPDGGR